MLQIKVVKKNALEEVGWKGRLKLSEIYVK